MDTPGAEALLRWWARDGAARVLASDLPALLQRSTGGRSLAARAPGGQDDEACRI